MTLPEPREPAAAAVEAALRHARTRLLTGRGPGASPIEVAAHTRNRAAIAGVPTTRRLELAARQTSRAREDAGGIVDAIELGRGELSVAARRLVVRTTPGALLDAAGRRILTGCGHYPRLVGGGLLLVIAIGRRRRRA
jgi:hypothetical protein